MDTHKPDAPEDSPYWTGGHTKHRLRFHLVWVPKYRRRVLTGALAQRRVLTGALAQRLSELLHEACDTNRWRVHELNIQPDHVHLLIQIEPERSVSKVLHSLKGGTSRVIRQEFRVIRQEFPDLREFLWGRHLWAEGYFAETVGQIEEAALRRYIREQQQPWPEETPVPSHPPKRGRNL